ncbi:MAG: tRNA (adenosine(37)-N6)-threonylcarbamoyltransferase complex dimerization subunit type 1 TsaB [Dehalococcoidia bacterium]
MADPAAEGLDLGIDTAADLASLALLRGDEVIAARAWRVDSTMSKELLAQLDALLEDAGATRGQIASIAVVTGPGQYGAVRTGLATAQGLALALDVPLAGIGRFEADAATYAGTLPAGSTVIAVHEAGRSGIAWGAYALDGADAAPRAVVEPRLSTLEDLLRDAPAGAVWCGEVTDALRDAIGRRGDTESGAPEAGPAGGGRAAALVRVARARQAYGDPALVDALYLRPPSITRARDLGPREA